MKEGKVTVTMNDETKEQGLGMRKFEENEAIATVSVGVGQNVPLRKKFHMAKPSVHVSLPCNVDNVDETLIEAEGIAREFLDKMVARIIEQDKKG